LPVHLLMPQLSFSMPSGEPRLSVLIGLNAQDSTKLIAAGRPVPNPVWAIGLIDTGTNVTCIAGNILHKLGISSFGQTSTHTASGPASVKLFEVSLSIPPASNLPSPMLTQGNLIVMELTDPIPDVEVLIGLDILLDCRLVLDGPGRQFTLDF
jgi:hypothetical protein